MLINKTLPIVRRHSCTYCGKLLFTFLFIFVNYLAVHSSIVLSFAGGDSFFCLADSSKKNLNIELLTLLAEMLEGIICDKFSFCFCFSVTNTRTLKHCYGNQKSRVDIDCDKCFQVLNFSFLSLFIFFNLKTILNTVITLTKKQMHFFCQN